MTVLRQLGLALLVPLVLGASASPTNLELNGQPLPGAPLADAWVPVWRLWPLGFAPELAPGDKEWILPDGTTIPLRWQGTSAMIPVDQLPYLGIKVNRKGGTLGLQKTMAGSSTWRIETDGSSCRLIWDTDAPIAWRLREDGRHVYVDLGGAGGSWPDSLPGQALLKSIRLKGTGPGTLQLAVERKYPTPVRLDTDGRHFVLEFDQYFHRSTRQDLPGGLQYLWHQSASAEGPVTWYQLTVPPTSSYRISPLTAQRNGRFTRLPVTRLAADAGAVAAVNAGYFSFNPELPVGLLVQDGKVLTSPIYNRSFIAWPAQGKPFLGKTQVSVELLAASGQSAEVDWVNYPRQRNSLAVYTDRFGERTGTKPDGPTWELAVNADGRIEATDLYNLPIPPGGFVVAAQGPTATWLKREFPLGALAALRPKVDQVWPGMTDAVAGGPTLVKDGAIALTTVDEKFAPDIAQGRAPRTGIGLHDDGTVTLLVVDGRDPGHSIGMTLAEFAKGFQAIGATQALNLDGGGSSTMVIQGKVVNKLSDGRERPVTTAIGLVAGPAVANRSQSR
jgi:uncharacterized protein YigE (DUF2233 family)